eukprot:1091529-Rhodomonas_salina.2
MRCPVLSVWNTSRSSHAVPPLRMLLDDEGEEDEERIPGSQLAKEIESSFVVACTQMGSSYQASCPSLPFSFLTQRPLNVPHTTTAGWWWCCRCEECDDGGDAGSQEGITSFVEAVLSAYEEGYSVPSMALELSSCPQQTAGRPLQVPPSMLSSLSLYPSARLPTASRSPSFLSVLFSSTSPLPPSLCPSAFLPQLPAAFHTLTFSLFHIRVSMLSLQLAPNHPFACLLRAMWGS